MAITQTHSRMISDLDAGTTYLTSSDIGTAAPLDVGTSANNVVQLDSTAKLPAVDGSQLTNVSAGKVLQHVHASVSSVLTGTTVMNADDTIPQNTEGNEVITLAITPTSATSRLLITANIFHSAEISAYNMITALFQDTTADALAAVMEDVRVSTAPLVTPLIYEMEAGTTSATTFKIRAGAGSAGTYTLNGFSGNRVFGGVASTTLSIMELSV